MSYRTLATGNYRVSAPRSLAYGKVWTHRAPAKPHCIAVTPPFSRKLVRPRESARIIRIPSARWLALYPDTHAGKPLEHSPFYTLMCFALLIGAYVVFDQANSQKNEFRLRRAGVVIDRVAFPQLPWAILKDPQFLKTSNGGTLLVDGWYQYCRKPHYMADILQALCWGLICGFEVLLPYWYVCFFVPMIIHRAVRDDARCA